MNKIILTVMLLLVSLPLSAKEKTFMSSNLSIYSFCDFIDADNIRNTNIYAQNSLSCDSRDWTEDVFYYGKSLSGDKLSYAFIKTTGMSKDLAIYHQKEFISSIEEYFLKGVDLSNGEKFVLHTEEVTINKLRFKISDDVYLYYCQRKWNNKMKYVAAITYGEEGFSNSHNCTSEVAFK